LFGKIKQSFKNIKKIICHTEISMAFPYQHSKIKEMRAQYSDKKKIRGYSAGQKTFFQNLSL